MPTRALQFDLLLKPIIDYRTMAVASGYKVYFFAANTSSPKNVWTELAKTNPYTELTLGSGGTASVFGDGIYKLLVVDPDLVTVYEWDNVKVQANTYTVQAKSDTYTATADDDIVLVDTTSGNVTINIATVLGFTHPLTIKMTAGSNEVTVNPYSTQTIDGDLTVTLTVSDDNIMLYPDYDSATWWRADRLPGLTATIEEINQLHTAFANEGLHIFDTNASHDLIIKPGSNLTADRILTITTGDVARTVTMDQSLDLSTTAYPKWAGLTAGTHAVALPTNGMNPAKFMLGDSNTITWFYLNAAPPGWKVLTTGAGGVIAVSGGADAYNVSGGSQGGTWTQPNHTHSIATHTHQIYNNVAGSAHDQIYDSAGAELNISGVSKTSPYEHVVSSTADGASIADAYTKLGGTTVTGDGATAATWRPLGSVGKLFQLDTS